MITSGNGARLEEHRLARSILAKVLLGACAFTTTFGVLAVSDGDALAAPHGTVARTIRTIYTSNDGACFKIDSGVRQWNDRMRMEGFSFTNLTCSPNSTVWFPPLGQPLVGYTLWKWNGNSAFVCETSNGWRTDNPIASVFRETYGCGDGLYLLRTHGAVVLDGAWRVGFVDSGWLEMDVNEHAPPI
jgi:hypothetical protein